MQTKEYPSLQCQQNGQTEHPRWLNIGFRFSIRKLPASLPKNTLLVKRLTERIPIVNYDFHSETNHIFLGFSKDSLCPFPSFCFSNDSIFLLLIQLAVSVLELFVLSLSLFGVLNFCMRENYY